MPFASGPWAGRHRASYALSGAYVSPYLLEILSTQPGAPAFVTATGSLTANTGQVVSCSRASSAYCLGNDGLLHLLGANTVRVEPMGLLVEPTDTNTIIQSATPGSGGNWTSSGIGVAAPTVTPNSTDVNDPRGPGFNGASKVVYPATVVAGTDETDIFTNEAGIARSVWLRTASGTATIWLHNFGIGGTGQGTLCNVTTTWQQFTFLPASSVQYLALGNDTRAASSGQPTNPACTLYVWAPMLSSSLSIPSSPILTSGASATRDADVVTVASNPLASQSQPVAFYRMRTTMQPAFPGNWNAMAFAYAAALSLGDDGNAANTAALYWRPDGILGFDTWDGSNAEKFGQTTGLGFASTSTAHVFEATNTNAGAFQIFLDSVNVSGGATGSGSGVINPIPATLRVGFTPASPAGISGPTFHYFRDIVMDIV